MAYAAAVDLSALPTRTLLRWDFTVRLLLALAVPMTVASIWAGELAGLGVGFVAMLVTMSSLGPDIGRVGWSLMSAVGAPIALIAGAMLADIWIAGGLLWVFLLFAAFGAFMHAGLVAQMAWFPVAATGMIGAVLVEGGASVDLLVDSVVGSAWAMLLIILVPLVVRAPRLPIPPHLLDPRVSVLRRMFTRPQPGDWAFPLLLGGLSAALLFFANLLTGGFRPYWTVFAFVSVLAPTAAKTRATAWQTVLGAVGGVVLAFGLAVTIDDTGALITITLLLGVVGAVVALKYGMLSKLLLTPLPVILISLLVGEDFEVVAGFRLFEYLGGILAAVLVAGLAEALALRLEEDRPKDEAEIAG